MAGRLSYVSHNFFPSRKWAIAVWRLGSDHGDLSYPGAVIANTSARLAHRPYPRAAPWLPRPTPSLCLAAAVPTGSRESVKRSLGFCGPRSWSVK
jgi:hypothetical protein